MERKDWGTLEIDKDMEKEQGYAQTGMDNLSQLSDNYFNRCIKSNIIKIKLKKIISWISSKASYYLLLISW